MQALLEEPQMLKHSAVSRGKRVLIVLHDGTRIVDKFLDKGNGWILLTEHGKIKLEDVRCMTIWR